MKALKSHNQKNSTSDQREQSTRMKLSALNRSQQLPQEEKRNEDMGVQNAMDCHSTQQVEAETTIQYPSRHEINLDKESCSSDNLEQKAMTATSTRNDSIKSEGFLGNVKLKCVNTSKRITFGKQSDSGTFVIPKLRPVRKAPHTLAIIMQQTVDKKAPQQPDHVDVDIDTSLTTTKVCNGNGNGKPNERTAFNLQEESPAVTPLKDYPKSTNKVAQIDDASNNLMIVLMLQKIILLLTLLYLQSKSRPLRLHVH